MVHAHANCVRVRRYRADLTAPTMTGNGYRRLKLRLVRAPFGIFQVNRRAGLIKIIAPLAAQLFSQVMSVPKQKRGKIYLYFITFRDFRLKTPNNGLRKSFFNRLSLIRVVTYGPVVIIRLYQ